MHSTEYLSDFPSPGILRKSLKLCALLDIVMCDEDWIRCYHYHPDWSTDEVMAKFDDDSGDHMYVLFKGTEAIIKGFDHESPLSQFAQDGSSICPQIYDKVPNNLMELVDDEAIEKEVVTFCIWCTENQWKTGNVGDSKKEDDGSAYLLDKIHFKPEDYVQWAEDYYECDFDLEIISALYDGAQFTTEIISNLNPDGHPVKALSEIEEALKKEASY